MMAIDITTPPAQVDLANSVWRPLTAVSAI